MKTVNILENKIAEMDEVDHVRKYRVSQTNMGWLNL